MPPVRSLRWRGRTSRPSTSVVRAAVWKATASTRPAATRTSTTSQPSISRPPARRSAVSSAPASRMPRDRRGQRRDLEHGPSDRILQGRPDVAGPVQPEDGREPHGVLTLDGGQHLVDHLALEGVRLESPGVADRTDIGLPISRRVQLHPSGLDLGHGGQVVGGQGGEEVLEPAQAAQQEGPSTADVAGGHGLGEQGRRLHRADRRGQEGVLFERTDVGVRRRPSPAAIRWLGPGCRRQPADRGGRAAWSGSRAARHPDGRPGRACSRARRSSPAPAGSTPRPWPAPPPASRPRPAAPRRSSRPSPRRSRRRRTSPSPRSSGGCGRHSDHNHPTFGGGRS